MLKILNEKRKSNQHIVFMYDIACQLQSFLKVYLFLFLIVFSKYSNPKAVCPLVPPLSHNPQNCFCPSQLFNKQEA